MSISALAPLSTIGFGVCALAHFALLLLLASRSRGQGSGQLLLLAVVAEILWSIDNGLLLTSVGAVPLLHNVAEALRNAGWIAFMLSLVSPPRTLVVAALVLTLTPLASDLLALAPTTSFAMCILVAVMALVCLEQVWRTTAVNRRWAMKFLCLALLAKFAFDLVMYSDALLYSRLDAVWWAARGYANALLVPLFAVSAARNREWKLDVNVSRQVVFHSATLLASGVFLLAVAVGGYVLKFFGGSWGAVAATMLAFTALVGLIVLITSGTVRAGLRVQLAKHFFSYRYDYRHEWLMLTRYLDGSSDTAGGGNAGPAESAELAQRGLRSLADLMESPGGALWLKDDDGGFHCQARSGRAGPAPKVSADEAWLAHLQAGEQIFDLRGNHPVSNVTPEPAVAKSAATSRGLPDWLAADREAAFLVPLLLDKELVGLVLLHRPRIAIDLDWEVRDLLRIAARQVASYLTVRRAVEALVQARQFESFNRMSAFVVHDLKNLVAQLSLMLRNAERHKGNPEFQEDMLGTVQNVLERMQGLMLQLATGAKPIEPARGVALAQAIRAAVRSRRSLKSAARLELDPSLENLEVTAHPARLERILGHLIQNATEASKEDSSILIRTRREGGQAVIEITDHGQGMSEDFIREQLFRPFSSTKTGGMGIGTFESREYIRELSGSIDVVSRPQAGTTFIVRLPVQAPVRSPASPAGALKEDMAPRGVIHTDASGRS